MEDKKLFLKNWIKNTCIVGIAMVMASVGVHYFGGMLKLKSIPTENFSALVWNLVGYTCVIGFIYTYQFQREVITIVASNTAQQDLLQRVLKKYKFKVKDSQGKSKMIYQSNLLNHLLMGRVMTERIGDVVKISGPKCVTLHFKQKMKGQNKK